ncbi:MAG: ribose-phosphate diphosphokinase [Candidatus Bathyarchaeota archaeon]|nr:ribose-phosphate diphosphokinase [Candidatus Bathyarchaeota archaeon]
MIIVPGPASTALGESVAKELGVDVVKVESKIFPDGESYIRFTRNVEGEDVIIVQSTYPPQDTHLVQFFLMIDNARKLKARNIVAVSPYLAYARQDKVFRPYEVVSIQTILKIFEGLGLNLLITVDVHDPRVFEYVSFKCLNLSAVKLLAEYFQNNFNLEKPVAFAPDEKAVKMVKDVVNMYGWDSGWFKKERDRVTGEISMKCESVFDVKNRDTIIFDDIISTGGTTATAARMLKSMGAKRVYSACVHPLLVGDAYEKIIKNGVEKIVATDTIPRNVSFISVKPLIVEALKSLNL